MRFILAFFASLIFSSFAVAASVEEDVQRYVQIFSGEKKLHSDAADTFSWMGLSDTRLFDIIERRLLEDAEANRFDRNEKNRVARYVRSLGFSGQSKYEPTITKFVGDVEYGRFARDALLDLPEYKKWNPIISDRSSFLEEVAEKGNAQAVVRHAKEALSRYYGKRDYQ